MPKGSAILPTPWPVKAIFLFAAIGAVLVAFGLYGRISAARNIRSASDAAQAIPIIEGAGHEHPRLDKVLQRSVRYQKSEDLMESFQLLKIHASNQHAPMDRNAWRLFYLACEEYPKSRRYDVQVWKWIQLEAMYEGNPMMESSLVRQTCIRILCRHNCEVPEWLLRTQSDQDLANAIEPIYLDTPDFRTLDPIEAHDILTQVDEENGG